MKLQTTMLAVGICCGIGCAGPGPADDSPATQALRAAGAGGVPVDDSGGISVATPPPPIVNGTLTATPNWVVEINFGGEFCSGWAINEHWILTAAHCLDGLVSGASVNVFRASGLGTRQNIYAGPASFFPHPSHTAHSAVHDVGLIMLQSFGLRIDLTGQAKMYSDTRRPWADSSISPAFHSSGWGLNTIDPNDSTNCIGSGEVLRAGSSGMNVDVTGAGSQFVSSVIGFQFDCSGDSGTPWMLSRGGADDLGFAVHSGRRGSPIKAQAATIDDNRSWIESTILADAGSRAYGEWCHESDAGGFRFRQCDQLDRGWGELAVPAGCLQASAATPGSAVNLGVCTPESHPQIWSFFPSGEVKSLLDLSLCLDVASTATGAGVRVNSCNNGLNQRFGHTARGELRTGGDFNQCVSGFYDLVSIPIGTVGTAAVAAEKVGNPAASALALDPLARTPATDDDAVKTEALVRFPFPTTVQVQPCNNAASQAWNWH